MSDVYRLEFKKLVLKLSRELSFKECEEMFYVYKNTAKLSENQRPCPETKGTFALRLLEALEKAGVFSYQEPKKLTPILTTLERKDLVSQVDTFLASYEEEFHPYYEITIGKAVEETAADNSTVQMEKDTINSRQLPPLPIHLQREDKTRVPLRRNRGGRQRKQSDSESNDSNDGYDHIDLNTLPINDSELGAPSSLSSHSSQSPAPLPAQGDEMEIDIELQSTGSTESEQRKDSIGNHVYEAPPDHVLQIIPSESRPLVEERIELPVQTIRDMIQEKRPGTVPSNKIPASHHLVSHVFFQLEVGVGSSFHCPSSSDNGGTSKYVSAQLFLLSENTFPNDLHMQAHITLVAPKTDSVYREKCLCEHTVLLDLPSVNGADTDREQDIERTCVAHFPNLMSHNNFMNDHVVSMSHLVIHLCIKEFC